MKIINDVNNNADFLSFSNKEDENTSLLGSLFSINIESSEVKSSNISDDLEFVFKEEEIEIIDYLSKIFPNLNVAKVDLDDFNSIKNEIILDQNLKTEIKDKLIYLLESDKNYSKNISKELTQNYQIKLLHKKNIINYQKSSKNLNENSKHSLSLMKSTEQNIDKSGEKTLKTNF